MHELRSTLLEDKLGIKSFLNSFLAPEFMRILKQDSGVLVTLENGLVKKTVRGFNHSGLRYYNPEEMVNREIKALQTVRGIKGIQKFIKRTSEDTFYSEYMPGPCLYYLKDKLNDSFFDALTKNTNECNKRGVYRIGQHRRDFLILPDGKPGIIDFGNVLFEDDPMADIPFLNQVAVCYSYLRIQSLRRRYT